MFRRIEPKLLVPKRQIWLYQGHETVVVRPEDRLFEVGRDVKMSRRSTSRVQLLERTE